jgi:iron(III) transport system permease protein
MDDTADLAPPPPPLPAPATPARSSARARLQSVGHQLRSPRGLVALVVIAYLAWQVLVPLASLLFASLKSVRPSDEGFLNLDLTLTNYETVLSTGRLWQITLTTAVFALGSATLALVIGAFLAWVTTQTSAPFRALVGSLVLYQLAVPELLPPISWTFLFGPRVGVFNQWWTSLTGIEEPLFNIYSLPGMIWVEAFLLIPLVYLFAVPAISGVNQSLEEAAQLSGASRFRTLRDVTLRLAAPALTATFIIVLVRSWEAFEVPWYLGVPQSVLTYSTEIYFRTVTPPSNTGLISSYAVPMLAVAVLLVLWYGKFNRIANRYAVIGGRSFRGRAQHLPRGVERVLGSVALGLVTLGVVLPVAMLLWISVLPFYRPPSGEALGFLTLDSYARIFESNNAISAFVNSFVIGLMAAVICVVVSTLAAWLVLRVRVVGSRLLDILTFLPMSIPNIIVGICFLWLYLMLPIGLIGSHIGLALAYVTLFLAIAARNIYSRMMQLHPELDEAARVSGASTFTTLRTITLPGLAPAVIAGLVYIMVWAFKELPNALLLSSPDSKTAAALMFDLSAMGTMADVSAIGMVTLGIVIVLVSVFQFFARRYGIRGF